MWLNAVSSFVLLHAFGLISPIPHRLFLTFSSRQWPFPCIVAWACAIPLHVKGGVWGAGDSIERSEDCRPAGASCRHREEERHHCRHTCGHWRHKPVEAGRPGALIFSSRLINGISALGLVVAFVELSRRNGRMPGMPRHLAQTPLQSCMLSSSPGATLPDMCL